MPSRIITNKQLEIIRTLANQIEDDSSWLLYGIYREENEKVAYSIETELLARLSVLRDFLLWDTDIFLSSNSPRIKESREVIRQEIKELENSKL